MNIETGMALNRTDASAENTGMPGVQSTDNRRESARISAVESFRLFDAPADDALQAICAMAARVCGSSNAVINIFDASWQRPLVCVGFEVGPLEREDALCEIVVTTGTAVYAADAAKDARLEHSPFVDGRLGEVHLYLSLPLTTPDGHTVGTLCVYDAETRELSTEQIETVAILARQVMAVFELRKAARQIAELADRASAAEHESAQVLAHAADAFISVDPHGRITAWNEAASAMFGHSSASAIGRDAAELLMPPDGRAAFRERMGQAAAGIERRVDTPTRLRVTHSDGTERCLQPCIWTTRTTSGAVKGFHAFLRDVSADDAAERARQEAEHLFQVAFDHAPVGMAVVDVREPRRGEIMRVNAALQSLFPRINLVGSHFTLLLAEEWVAQSLDSFTALADGAIESYEATRKLTTDNEAHSWVHSTAGLVRDADGVPLHAIVQLRDVTRERAHEEWLTQQATSDALTGLPNRLALMERLDASLNALRTDRYGVGVLFFDIDAFKQVNDLQGHAAGDEVLRRLANYLADNVPAEAMVGRLGGDEFAVVLRARSAPEVEALGELLSGGVRATTGVGGSVGWAWTRDPATAAAELLATADRRMYARKRSRKSLR
jgi:diguanylate cyclase (GGDEF)-like protein/PAS domain S-box-containing protein